MGRGMRRSRRPPISSMAERKGCRNLGESKQRFIALTDANRRHVDRSFQRRARRTLWASKSAPARGAPADIQQRFGLTSYSFLILAAISVAACQPTSKL